MNLPQILVSALLCSLAAMPSVVLSVGFPQEAIQDPVAGEQTNTLPDPSDNPCENGALQTLLKKQGAMTADEGYPDDVFTACAYLPFDEYTAMVAVMKPSKTADRYEQQGELDLHLLQINNDAEVLREGYFPAAGETGGFSLNGIHIDLALSGITSELGGFAIVSSNSTRCSACEADLSEAHYSLFVMRQSSIDLVLPRHQVASENTDRAANAAHCTNAGTASQTEISQAQSAHHGLFDIILTTTTTQVPGDVEDGVTSCAVTQPAHVTRARWQFDGHRYQPTKS